MMFTDVVLVVRFKRVKTMINVWPGIKTPVIRSCKKIVSK